jgi:hypothetical protein
MAHTLWSHGRLLRAGLFPEDVSDLDREAENDLTLPDLHKVDE